MALSAKTVWELRTGGASTNGGGFNQPTVFVVTPVDYSQQNSPQYAVTDAVTNGTSTITSATGGFAGAMLGNLLYIQGGSGSITANWYEITAVGSAVSITVDRSTGLSVGTGATLNVGGAFNTPSSIASVMIPGNTAWVKAGTYNIATGVTFAQTDSSAFTKIIGYSATRGDNGMATFKATAGITIITLSGWNSSLQNIEIDGDSVASTIGYANSATYPGVTSNIKVHHCTSGGIVYSGSGDFTTINKVEVYNCGGTNAAFELIKGNISFSYIHDNTVSGIYTVNAGNVLNFVISESNSGGSSDGFNLTFGSAVFNCVAYNNGRDGIRTRTFNLSNSFFNNILVSNAGYGINNSAGTSTVVTAGSDYNAFYSNTSGARNGLAASPNDVTLTGDPFVSSSGGNFALNSTAGAGTACKATGFPGSFPGAISTGFLSRGTIQPDPTLSGGGSLIGDGLISVV